MNTLSGNEIIESPDAPQDGAVELITRAELDVQIVTAHRFPRSMAVFQKRALAMATLDEETAESCIYRRPVGKKKNEQTGKWEESYAEGMSIRMAEIVGASYGNLRVGASLIEQTERFVRARGFAHDLETNFASTSEVVEATTDKDGKPYSERMRVVVAKAALSKARRDATFSVVPRALCRTVEIEARRVAVGDAATLERRRAAAMQWIDKIGVKRERVFASLGVAGEADIGIDQLVTLMGLKTALKDGEITIEEAFAVEGDSGGGGAAPPPEPKRKGDAAGAGPAAAPRTAETKPTPPPPPAPEKPAQATKFADDIFPPAAKAPVSEGGLSPEEEARWQAEKMSSMQSAMNDTVGITAARALQPDSGELCTAGERAWLLKRIKPDALPGMLAKVGAKSLEALTRVQFDAIRAGVV